MNIEIIPSLLTKSEQEFASQYRAIQNSVSCVHIDIADGEFVPNKTWADPAIIKDLVGISVELHLMVADPLEELVRWRHVSQIERALLHYETIADCVPEALTAIEGYCWQKSLVLNPGTPIDVIYPYADRLFGVMFMGINPGFQGQTFMPAVLKKISALKKKHPHLFLEIDGGVNEATLPGIIATGVDAVCPGSAIFKNTRTPAENVTRMHSLIARLTKQP